MEKGIKRLISEEYVVLDGATGTLLQDSGLSTDTLPEEWNILRPEVLKGIHLDYLRSGAQIIETNTFGATAIKLGMKGKSDLMEEVNRRGARIAVEALKEFSGAIENSGDRYIGGSVGPTGQMVGVDMSEQEARKSFASQGTVLADNGVNLFIVETMMNLNEALIALRALMDETDLPVVVSLVFNRTKKGDYRTLYGNTVSEAVEKLTDAGADAIGTNCGLIEDYIDVIGEMRSLTSIPLILYPNAGAPKLRGDETYFEQTPEFMISYLEKEIEAGATIIGGCCGTTPEYTALISQRLKGRKRK
ncbi:MAG: homocysteine S-methyltransferase family protein [Spirochaetota bacterium]|nr:MAG: homocysteine S-methyltransferase family protein [Spirochaetota bacterium]